MHTYKWSDAGSTANTERYCAVYSQPGTYQMGDKATVTDADGESKSITAWIAVTVAAPPTYGWVNEGQSCPAGQTGSITWQEYYELTPVRKDMGTRRNYSDTCHSPPPPPTYGWINESQVCPAGQIGSITWQEYFELTPVRKDMGTRRNYSNTCHVRLPPPPPPCHNRLPGRPPCEIP